MKFVELKREKNNITIYRKLRECSKIEKKKMISFALSYCVVPIVPLEASLSVGPNVCPLSLLTFITGSLLV